jgi:hypothetical protein
MDKKEDFINESIIADLLVRVTALELTLTSTGVINAEVLANKYKEIADILAKSILKNANVQGDLDQIVKEFREKNEN